MEGGRGGGGRRRGGEFLEPFLGLSAEKRQEREGVNNGEGRMAGKCVNSQINPEPTCLTRMRPDSFNRHGIRNSLHVWKGKV